LGVIDARFWVGLVHCCDKFLKFISDRLKLI